jgi:tRNA(Glu) U13 pseudouridine synthase TruD
MMILAAVGPPSSGAIERGILISLVKSSTDYVSALMTLPRNMRMLYLHAYQSMVRILHAPITVQLV